MPRFDGSGPSGEGPGTGWGDGGCAPGETGEGFPGRGRGRGRGRGGGRGGRGWGRGRGWGGGAGRGDPRGDTPVGILAMVAKLVQEIAGLRARLDSPAAPPEPPEEKA